MSSLQQVKELCLFQNLRYLMNLLIRNFPCFVITSDDFAFLSVEPLLVHVRSFSLWLQFWQATLTVLFHRNLHAHHQRSRFQSKSLVQVRLAPLRMCQYFHLSLRPPNVMKSARLNYANQTENYLGFNHYLLQFHPLESGKHQVIAAPSLPILNSYLTYHEFAVSSF